MLCKEWVKAASTAMKLWHDVVMAILLVDDDTELCELIARFLAAEGFEVSCCHDGNSALELLNGHDFELLLLDIMMPGRNGMDLLRELRSGSTPNKDLPVIMLTARGEEMDRIIGLELGADDYLAKPCNPRELAARIRAVLRRTAAATHPKHPEQHRFGTLLWQPQSRRVQHGAAPIELTATEYNILAILMQHAGEVVEKPQLSREALGKPLGPFDRALDVHIGHLRKKLPRSITGEPRIKTIRSVGWLFMPE